MLLSVRNLIQTALSASQDYLSFLICVPRAQSLSPATEHPGVHVDGAKPLQLAGGICLSRASTRRVNQLTRRHRAVTQSRGLDASRFPLRPHRQVPASTCQLQQAGSGGESAGAGRQRVPDGILPGRAVATGQSDAATLPWKWSAVFRLRASTVSSVSAHSKTSLRPYKCVLWHRALNAFCRIKRKKQIVRRKIKPGSHEEKQRCSSVCLEFKRPPENILL